MHEPGSVSLREAMTQIADIREQLAHTRTFRGYRSRTVALSGLFALIAAILQPLLIPQPASALPEYLLLWVGTAVLSLTVLSTEMLARCWRERSRWAMQMHMLALELFLPCVLVGAFVTFFIYRSVPEVGWMLPGLWCLLFSLGCFASFRLLPSVMIVVPLFYLLAGTLCLSWATGEAALSPWAMAIPFGGGQLLSAGLLYWMLERNVTEEHHG